MRTISTEELRKKIDDKEDFVLVDVLGTESFKSKHIPTSKDIDVNEIEDRADKELPDKNEEIIVYCASKECQASPNAAKKLERDAVTGKPREPNEKFLRSIEEHIPWTVEEAKAARGELLERRASDPTFSFETYSPLRRAVQKKLISDAKATLSLVLSQDSIKGDEETRRANELFGTLKKQNFCKVCAKEIITEARKCLEE